MSYLSLLLMSNICLVIRGGFHDERAQDGFVRFADDFQILDISSLDSKVGG